MALSLRLVAAPQLRTAQLCTVCDYWDAPGVNSKQDKVPGAAAQGLRGTYAAMFGGAPTGHHDIERAVYEVTYGYCLGCGNAVDLDIVNDHAYRRRWRHRAVELRKLWRAP